MGFEPTNGGFADLSLGPLGYRAKTLSITKLSPPPGQVCVNILLSIPYLFIDATGDAIFASRRNRADSSGGVGLM